MGERFHKSVIGAIGIGNVGQGNGLHAFKVRNLGSKFLVGAVAVGAFSLAVESRQIPSSGVLTARMRSAF